MSKQKTQIAHLKEHLRSGRSISPLEALGLYGVFRLAARIKELRNAGWAINTDIGEDRTGRTYARYALAAPTTDAAQLPLFAMPDSHQKDAA